MKESDIQRQILDYLKLRRIWHVRMNSGALPVESGGKRRFIRFGAPGMPDIMARTTRTIIWIEIKSDRGRQTPDQKRWQSDAEGFGDIYVLARSLDDVRALFEPRRGHA